MAASFLLAVDEDRGGLADLEAQLVRRYGLDYRVECLADPAEALRLLTELADDGGEVALVLVRNAPSRTTASDLFDHVRQLHPHAKRALLVPSGAWTDQSIAEAIRTSLALGRIDYYVLSPEGLIDEVFHDAVSSFLLEWARDRSFVPQTVHIVGETWTGRAYELRQVFEQCSVPHSFCLADSERGRELLLGAGSDLKLPAMVLPDGRVLADPSNAEIAEAAGAPLGLGDHSFDVVIIGTGPAGLSAAVYGASEGLRVLVIDEGGIGGQARSSSLIRNYLGFAKGVSGSRLAEQAYDQALAFGASFVLMHRAVALTRSGNRLTVSLADGREITAGVVILATGAAYRRLNVPSLEALHGAGVFYGGALSEAPELVLRSRTADEDETVAADALFVMIGAHPHGDWLPVDIAKDAHGFLLTGSDIPEGAGWSLERRPLALETSMPGVLAAGDVRHGSVKRVASAVGEGAIAVQLLHSLLADELVQGRHPTDRAAAIARV